jgi:hypothetical protein
MWTDFQVKALLGRQGFCVGKLLHATERRDSRCGNAQPSRHMRATACRADRRLKGSSGPNPTFATHLGAAFANVRIRGPTSKLMKLVELWI